MPTEEWRGYGVSRKFSPSMKFGVAGTPVLNFGVKNRAAEMGKARNKGVLGSKNTVLYFGAAPGKEQIWIQRTSRESVCIWTKKR